MYIYIYILYNICIYTYTLYNHLAAHCAEAIEGALVLSSRTPRTLQLCEKIRKSEYTCERTKPSMYTHKNERVPMQTKM